MLLDEDNAGFCICALENCRALLMTSPGCWSRAAKGDVGTVGRAAPSVSKRVTLTVST